MDHLPSIIIAFATTLLMLWLLQPIAKKTGFVDKPSDRKKHQGEIPLIGGIAMFCGVAAGVLINTEYVEGMYGLIFGSIALLIIGTIDDKYNLRARSRFIVQISAALLAIYLDGTVLHSLGSLFNDQPINLGVLAIPFTVLAIVGVINAVNMTDGMDGLAGGLSAITLGGISIAAILGGANFHSFIPPVMVAALLAFLLLNMRTKKRKHAKVFMGDGGSMFIGFVIAWILIKASQGENAVITPVTALWLITLPLLDTVCIMLRRIIKGRSPFSPDREHFHHILLVAGYSVRRSVNTMFALAGLTTVLGILGFLIQTPDSIMFAGFLTLFALYFWGMSHAWKVMKAIRPEKPVTTPTGSAEILIGAVKRSKE